MNSMGSTAAQARKKSATGPGKDGKKANPPPEAGKGKFFGKAMESGTGPKTPQGKGEGNGKGDGQKTGKAAEFALRGIMRSFGGYFPEDEAAMRVRY